MVLANQVTRPTPGSREIVFDLDGTLIDTSDRNYRLYSDLTKNLKGTPLSQRRYWNLKRRKVPQDEILQLSQVDPNFTTQFTSSFISSIEQDKYLASDKLFPFTLETLSKLKDAWYRLFLISFRQDAPKAEAQIKKFGLLPYFTKIMVGRKSESGSETKTLFVKEMLNDTGPVMAVMVGDTEDDILAAKQLGFIAVGVLSGIRDREFLRKLAPDYLVKDIRYLPDILQSLS